MAIKRNKKQVYNTITALRNETTQAVTGDAVYVKELKKTFNWVSGNSETDDSKYIINQTSESANGRWVADEVLKGDLLTKWDLGGNAGTNPATDFIGTTDAQPLVVKTNNVQVGRFTADAVPRLDLQRGGLRVYNNGETNWGSFYHSGGHNFLEGEDGNLYLSAKGTTTDARIIFRTEGVDRAQLLSDGAFIIIDNGGVSLNNSGRTSLRKRVNIWATTESDGLFIGDGTGATTPTQKLDLQGNMRIRGGGWIGSTDANLLSFRTNNLDRITILSDGKIGIGTATPTTNLQVVGLPTYADNTAALGGGLTAGAMYIRTGHGLDIVV